MYTDLIPILVLRILDGILFSLFLRLLPSSHPVWELHFSLGKGLSITAVESRVWFTSGSIFFFSIVFIYCLMKWAEWVTSFGVHTIDLGICFAKIDNRKRKALQEGYCRIISFLCGTLFLFSFLPSPSVHLHGLVPVSTVGTARTYVRFGLVV